MDTQVILLCNITCIALIILVLPVSCNTCPVNCQTCNNNIDSLGDVEVCTSCNEGFWLSESSCLLCPDNCVTCFNATSCRTCKLTFYRPDSACYFQCPTDCLNGICDDNTGHCVACPHEKYGYTCNLDCGLCKNEQCELRKCSDGCKRGYWQYQDGEHYHCRACMDNCSSCNTGLICKVCNDGTYLSEYTGQRNYCSLCRSGCETCSSSSSCSVCNPGYYGGVCEFSCSAQIPDCYQCDWDGFSTVTCSQCVDGFTLQDNTCKVASQRCPYNCESCTADNVCEICKTGWYGVLCNKPCHDVPHCDACQETDGSIVCKVCNVEYVVIDGECRVAPTTSTSLQPTSYKSAQISSTSAMADSASASNARTSATTSSATETSKPSTNSVEPECFSPISQSENTSFQTSTFAVGLVTGLGVCLCSMLVVGLVWFLRRRRRLQKSTTSRQNEPFYENSITTHELKLTSVSSHDPKPENIQHVRAVIDDTNDPMEDNQQAPGDEESVPTYTDIEQHEYTSLDVHQGEHIYKGLTTL